MKCNATKQINTCVTLIVLARVLSGVLERGKKGTKILWDLKYAPYLGMVNLQNERQSKPKQNVKRKTKLKE